MTNRAKKAGQSSLLTLAMREPRADFNRRRISQNFSPAAVTSSLWRART
jgi:hypothetical protein